jgi:double-stranded uracil-DNA glycosylase
LPTWIKRGHGETMTELEIERCFAPVVDGNTRLLLLGSLPGAQSLAARRYYANPRNQFWALVGGVLGIDLVGLAYEDRLAALLERQVGLWDTVAAARRRGSLDADIRLHAASDLAGLAGTLPSLRAIGFNGGTSARIGRQQIGQTPVALIDLPSSSPAYTLPFADKLARWRVLRRYL